MKGNFWNKLPKPFFVLAPMADVTDAAFRQIIAKYGKPDAMYTEFVSADGLFGGGKDVLMKNLEFTETERPIVAQFFSREPELMKQAAELAVKLGFDGVDINMGCPDKNICKQGAGAAMIKEPKLAREIIRAAKEGAGSFPVSVKTRIGYNKIEIDTWLPGLLAEEPAAVILHARTKKEMSKAPAHWDVIARAMKIRDELGSKTLIVGNGGVTDLEDGRRKAKETGCDGVMIGKAAFGNPWLFSGKKSPVQERLRVMVEHTKLFEKLLGDVKSFSVMKKHFKAYVSGFDGAKELRIRLMETQNASEVEKTIEEFLDATKS